MSNMVYRSLMGPIVDQILQQGVAAHNEGNIQEAEHSYRAVLQVQPRHPDASHNLGLIAVAMNQSVAELGFFKAAVEASPNEEQFWSIYLETLLILHRFEDAKRVLKKGKKKGVSKRKLKTLTQKLILAKKRCVLTPAPSEQQRSSLLGHYQAGRY